MFGAAGWFGLFMVGFDLIVCNFDLFWIVRFNLPFYVFGFIVGSLMC